MISVAIDGPAGAGKSTIAKEVAKRLDYLYVDTGALYRAIALHLLRKGVDLADETAIEPNLNSSQLTLSFQNGVQKVYLGEEDVSRAIREPEVSMVSSQISAHPCVREFLLHLQQDLAKQYNVIMDGRDIGTVVLPNADLKLFLTATAYSRARRRYLELRQETMTDIDFEEVLKDMQQRDYQDTHRKISPLRPADDAEMLDSTNLTLFEVVDLVVSKIQAVATAKQGA